MHMMHCSNLSTKGTAVRQNVGPPVKQLTLGSEYR